MNSSESCEDRVEVPLQEEDSAPCSKAQARALLGKKFKVLLANGKSWEDTSLHQVEVIDGRVFIGQFYCLDGEGRIILMDAYEIDSASLLSTQRASHENQWLAFIKRDCE